MKVSLSWLNEYIPVRLELTELAERLTMAGLEVDSLTDRYEWLDTVRVGRIVSVKPHPNADKLTLCRVDLGDRQVNVVCGAPNVRENMLSPLALPGTEFPNGMVLEKGVIRGEASEGMLCSQAELELDSDASGIMDLDEGLEVGQALNKALNLSDVMIEIDLTPNRPDCLSLLGVAREIGSFQDEKITYPAISLPDAEKQIADLTSVTIDHPDHCPRYAARLIKGITVKPSPFWLKDRLLSVGLRPINNIVDVTNFVMMETGQPLHAFDFDHLEEHRIVVRTAAEGEKFTTLDGKERTLAGDMLMICDGVKPVAVGGVMGGLNSEIEDDTVDVLIESAYFDPVSIRRTAKRLGLGTDASHRFERGVDPEGTLTALNRAAQLMLETAGGTLVGGEIDERPKMVKNKAISLSVAASNRHLGIDLTEDEIAKLLSSIEFEAKTTGKGIVEVMPPSFRVDVMRQEDLMEEVARLWGYNNIPTTFPVMPAKGLVFSERLTARNRVKDLMAGYGFSEAINYSFIDEASCDKLQLASDDPRRKLLHILNPLTEDQSVMRTTLIPGLLYTMGRNLSRQNRNLKLFEVGKSFISNGQEKLPDEHETVSGLWTGASHENTWHTKEVPCDFYDLKGIVEALLAGLDIESPVFTAETACDMTRSGHTARIEINGVKVGIIGEVHPLVLKAYDLKQAAFIFEMDLDKLLPMISQEIQAQPIPRFPSTARDITIIVDSAVEAADILRRVKACDEALLEDILLFDVYEGDNIPKGKKSVSFRIVYRSSEETLADEVVSGIHERISAMLLQAFNASFPA